ncbi:MAG: hypothetical protein AB7N76_35930 [Planctomycetota bacterium]
MAHPKGERLRCEACGAEIVFVEACPCPERDPKQHYDICCGEPMKVVTGGEAIASARPQPAERR